MFIGEDVEKLVQRLMEKFVKKDILEKADSPTKLASVNLKTKDNLLPPRKTDVGVATASLLTTCTATELQRLEFYNGAQDFLKALVEKLLEKSPLHHNFVRYLSSLNPVLIFTNKAQAMYRFRKLIEVLHAKRWVSGSDGDMAKEEYELLCANVTQYYKDEFYSYKSKDKRLDEFLFEYLGENDRSNDYMVQQCITDFEFNYSV